MSLFCCILCTIDVEGLKAIDFLPADWALAVPLNDNFSTYAANRHVITGLCDCVFLIAHADDALSRALLIGSSLVQSIRLLEDHQSCRRHNLLSNQSHRIARHM